MLNVVVINITFLAISVAFFVLIIAFFRLPDRQIAVIIARRIFCNVKEGDEVKQSDELGFIMFGSRVDVFLPSGVVIFVEMKDKVKGNITILGNL